MTVKLRSVGNSTTITIPRDVVKLYNLTQGSEVSIEAVNDGILVKPVEHHQDVTVRSLFAGYTGDYKPTEVDWGDKRGNEIW